MIEEMRTQTESSEMLTSRPWIDSDNLRSIATNAFLIVLCVIASLVSFWDIRFTFDRAFTVGWVAVLLYLVSTTVYQTKYDGGVYKGRQTEAYKTALKVFQSVRDKITDGILIDALRDWCNAYRIKDMDTVRKNIVCPYMSYDTYLEKYVNLSSEKVDALDLSKKAKKAINQANRVEPVELTSDMLLNLSFSKSLFGKRRILPRSGDEQRVGDLLSNYVQKFFITFICGMFIVEVVSDPTLDTFLQWIIRMVPIVMAFLTGPAGGFRNASEVSVKRMDAQTKMLNSFLADMRINDDEKKEIVSLNGTGDRTHCFAGELHGASE